MSDEGRAPPGDEPEGAADAIFDRFVKNAYAGTTGPEAKWAASVEELLEDNVVTEVGARPILRVHGSPRSEERAGGIDDRDPPAGDTEVTRSAKAPRRPEREPPASDTDLTRAVPSPPRTETKPEEPRSVEVPVPLITRADPDGTLRVVLLTNRKAPTVPPPAATAPEAARPPLESPEWKSLVRAPSSTTQRREALLVVPEVAKVEAPASPMREGSEDGMIPGGELDRKLGDMAVLLRYGHEVQVQREIDTLQAQYPRDLLMLRRIAEFWIATGHTEHARELLFSLATGLFERRNVEGMRQALEQVLVLDPGNERAARLIGLLDQRPTHER